MLKYYFNFYFLTFITLIHTYILICIFKKIVKLRNYCGMSKYIIHNKIVENKTELPQHLLNKYHH